SVPQKLDDLDFATPSRIATRDLNGDGIADLIVVETFSGNENGGSAEGGVFARLGDGAGGFGPRLGSERPNFPPTGVYFINSLAIADVNGDGIADLAFTGFEATNTAYDFWTPILAIGMGNGEGTFAFSDAQIIGGDVGRQSLFLAGAVGGDLNGDGN